MESLGRSSSAKDWLCTCDALPTDAWMKFNKHVRIRGPGHPGFEYNVWFSLSGQQTWLRMDLQYDFDGNLLVFELNKLTEPQLSMFFSI